MELDITDASKRVKELGEKVGAKFERADRFQELTRRQSEIEEELDLTKNQAPSQVDAAVTEEREDNLQKQTETKSIQKTRRTAIRV